MQRGLKAEYRSSGETLAWLAAADIRANRYENNVEAAIDLYDRRGNLTNLAGAALSDDTTDETVNAVYGEIKYRLAKPLVMTVNGRYDHIAYDFV